MPRLLDQMSFLLAYVYYNYMPSLPVWYFVPGSWSKVPRDTKANITPEDTANGDVEIVPTLTFEIVSARTISDEKEKKHVVCIYEKVQ